jgi:hypothetical protein
MSGGDVFRQAGEREKKRRGSFAEGPRHPGFILPASAVSEQGTRRETFAPQEKSPVKIFPTANS